MIYHKTNIIMQKYKRKLDLEILTSKKSYFLFGPRGTGKSFLIRETFRNQQLNINLLKTEDYLDLKAHPENLRQRVQIAQSKFVIIDEVQKIPELLNEVHYLIEEEGYRFLLTGSSVRRLKSKNTNMLGGRARTATLFPLTSVEFEKFNLDKYLRFGGLPAVTLSEEPREDLSAYLYQYINEEVKIESNVRKIDYFHRFLETAAMTSAESVNFANIASDIGVSEPTVKSYYEILEDTLLGFQISPWRKGLGRKAVTSNKFYFFDTGILHTILRSPSDLDRNSNIYGKTFEQFVAQEIRAYISYHRLDVPLNYWRTLDKCEVDFVINNEIAIEVKSARKVKNEFLIGLKKIKDENKIKKRLLVTQDPLGKVIDGIICIHWQEFLSKLWQGKIIE